MSGTSSAELEKQEQDIVWPAFGPAEAWRLGMWLAETAWERKYPIAIDIRKPGLIMFRSVLPGATPDQEEWVRRKAAVVLRMETSSRLFALKMSERGIDPVGMGWLDGGYAVTGGSVPIRVDGSGVVAAVTASGLSSNEDHDFVLEGITVMLDSQGTRANADSRTFSTRAQRVPTV